MEFEPYLETLRRDLTAAAAPGGAEVGRAANLLSGALDASMRLCLLEVLSDATAEITTQLDDATVEVRIRGRSADLVVNQVEPAAMPVDPVGATGTPGTGGTATAPDATTTTGVPPLPEGADLARVSLRLPEPLKEQIDRAAATEGISVNAWLVRAAHTALHAPPRGGTWPGGPPAPPAPPAPPVPGLTVRGRRMTGYAQA